MISSQEVMKVMKIDLNKLENMVTKMLFIYKYYYSKTIFYYYKLYYYIILLLIKLIYKSL